MKQAESFALKLETGRVSDPNALEDFFGCMIVVRNRIEVGGAEELARREFEFVSRRPKDPNLTFKNPEAFPFDDLRLYLRWKDDPSLPPSGLSGITFELQVKTFLMHAWAIATHDLVYKTDDVRWGKERIAFQIRAMLEHAEVSIAEAERLAASDSLGLETETTGQTKDAIKLLKEFWDPSALPSDVRRLATTVLEACRALRISLDDLKAVLEKEAAQGRGAKTLDLSPFASIVQSLLNQEPAKMRKACERDKSRFRFLIPGEVALPSEMATLALPAIIPVQRPTT
ncbi:MAG: hypothetical protein U1E73_09840 [Planctomycetota bacterium]